MGAGRPTKYNPEILEKARAYIDNYGEFGDVIPSVAGLSLVLQISRETVYDWAKQEEKQEFSYILQDILAKQESLLVNNGLDGEFNSNITKLVLGKHGYHEKVDNRVALKEMTHEEWLDQLDE